MTEFKETDLYEPIRAFLEEEGYQVQAEVKHCDIAAEKNGRLVVVELKRAFGLKLVYQGLERQSLTDEVFVAIPRPKKGAREKAWQDMLRLLKRLELGLLTVALDSPLKTVDVVLTPADSMIRKNKRKKEQLQAELEGRQLDANIGGMTRRKIIIQGIGSAVGEDFSNEQKWQEKQICFQEQVLEKGYSLAVCYGTAEVLK